MVDFNDKVLCTSCIPTATRATRVPDGRLERVGWRSLLNTTHNLSGPPSRVATPKQRRAWPAGSSRSEFFGPHRRARHDVEKTLKHDAQSMAAGAGDHLMLSRLGLGEDNAEKAGSSTLLLHENVVSFRRRRYPPISAPGARVCLLAAAGHRRLFSNRLARDTSAARWAVAMAHRPPACSARR